MRDQGTVPDWWVFREALPRMLPFGNVPRVSEAIRRLGAAIHR
jgi:hypothetical protein